jgi:hypothetical protein
MKYVLSILLMVLAWYSLFKLWHVYIGQNSLWDYFAGVLVFTFLQTCADESKK